MTSFHFPLTHIPRRFHPVAYLVKLNIEMSLANLIARLARSGNRADAYAISNSQSDQRSRNHIGGNQDVGLKSFTRSTVKADGVSTSASGIQKRLDYKVTIEQGHSRNRSADDTTYSSDEYVEDQVSPANNAGYPRGPVEAKLTSSPAAEV